MSASEERAVPCPSCNQVSNARVYTSIDASEEPALKDELLRGKLFVFTCPKCGHAARLVDPLFSYHDGAKDLVIQLDTLGKFDAAKAVASFGAKLPKTARVVRDGNSLIEKVKVFDAGLDDRIVEAFKLVARSTQPDARAARILFEAVEGTGEASRLRFTLLSKEGRISALAAPRPMYDNLELKLAKDKRLVTPEPFTVVDEAFAGLLLAG
ncbi:hypothetical protein AKJ09_10010 [Labilithrix luteola]|uniref:CpXC domain-containing protein n=1 Tax=Labilithrix luteola TaxID=1391654 RepID=A0A0K1QCG4_9BACT|nr:CpXC domain-containing protein [Labilithrix luteola]AKV03347.1 hypothetical protein AKJ09_10010 [Labilithrix luteola]